MQALARGAAALVTKAQWRLRRCAIAVNLEAATETEDVHCVSPKRPPRAAWLALYRVEDGVRHGAGMCLSVVFAARRPRRRLHNAGSARLQPVIWYVAAAPGGAGPGERFRVDAVLPMLRSHRDVLAARVVAAPDQTHCRGARSRRFADVYSIAVVCGAFVTDSNAGAVEQALLLSVFRSRRDAPVENARAGIPVAGMRVSRRCARRY